MTVPSSTHILIDTLAIPSQQRPTTSVLANSCVLDYLLPELSSWQTVKQETLEKVDDYMLLETKQVLQRISKAISQITLCGLSHFIIKIKPMGATFSLEIQANLAEKSILLKQINHDKWLVGALAWLCPNYMALAHSQELLSFSYLYEKSKQEAHRHYQHFSLKDQGIYCYLDCNMVNGKPNLSWRLKSPKTNFTIKEL
ncbi:hypothetical protein [uncultured Paraglaciecola sp.]|uniref:hypothetical protein n=1 Tax=uncultured Paraglaciecola sp. TaxID=1765024 RepID=UPI0025978A60|nr:hypothetical protein [uncultured Paraglaciecola sp.]